MNIACPNLKQFMEVIVELLARGIRFNADADTLTIQLTGGF